MSILNSHFSYSFSNIFYSNMVLFKTNNVQDSFSYILNNALFFTENNEETIKPTVIKSQTFISQQKYDSFSGKFIIIGCTFSKCEIINVENKDNGGALYIEQDCLLTIHGTTFTECKASFNGGAAYICKRRVTFNYVDDYYTQIEDEKLPEANIQYCCFDRCQSGYENNDGDASKGFGPNAMIAGTKVNLLYTSSSNHLREKPDRSRARSGVFDIQSIDVSILHINVTEGYSKVTGALDIRGAQSGKSNFRHLTKWIACTLNLLSVQVDSKFPMQT